MWYLKTNFIGYAEKLMRYLPLSTENYDEALKVLQYRNSNKWIINSSILQQFLGQPVNVSAFSSIRKLRDTTELRLTVVIANAPQRE